MAISAKQLQQQSNPERDVETPADQSWNEPGIVSQSSAELEDVPSLRTRAETPKWQIVTSSFPRLSVTLICVVLALLVGYLDYLTGYEQSLLLFYLVPIAIATWFGGLVLGLT